MNGDSYETWFTTKLINNIQPNSVIVIDNAPYHSIHTEYIQKSSSKKSEIQEWLTNKNIR